VLLCSWCSPERHRHSPERQPWHYPCTSDTHLSTVHAHPSISCSLPRVVHALPRACPHSPGRCLRTPHAPATLTRASPTLSRHSPEHCPLTPKPHPATTRASPKLYISNPNAHPTLAPMHRPSVLLSAMNDQPSPCHSRLAKNPGRYKQCAAMKANGFFNFCNNV
jgi:hypothetical protein